MPLVARKIANNIDIDCNKSNVELKRYILKKKDVYKYLHPKESVFHNRNERAMTSKKKISQGNIKLINSKLTMEN